MGIFLDLIRKGRILAYQLICFCFCFCFCLFERLLVVCKLIWTLPLFLFVLLDSTWKYSPSMVTNRNWKKVIRSPDAESPLKIWLNYDFKKERKIKSNILHKKLQRNDIGATSSHNGDDRKQKIQHDWYVWMKVKYREEMWWSGRRVMWQRAQLGPNIFPSSVLVQA